MPLFDFVCDDCGQPCELLLLGREEPVCPACGSSKLTKQLSLPSVVSDGTRAKSLRAAKKRDRRMGETQMRERIEYESSHDD